MSEIEIIRMVNNTTDPKTLISIYEENKTRPRVVKSIVFNKYCPDEIKKDYIEYNLTVKLPAYKTALSESAWDENLEALKKCLQSWRPVRTSTPPIKIDTEDEEYKELIKIIETRKQVILYGPPGTSKTYLAKGLAYTIAGSEDNIETVQFHPSYSYEDFIEGIFPQIVEGNVRYQVIDKIFKKFCSKAEIEQEKYYVFIIDEINRADLSKVFGELLSGLEYRKQPITLLYSQEKFIIPENVVIIGTMNTLDKSTIEIDYALRRRFYFYNVKPDPRKLVNILKENNVQGELIGKVVSIFNKIQNVFPLGHAYFKDIKDEDDLVYLWNHQLEPLLEEHFGEFERDKFEKAKECFF